MNSVVRQLLEQKTDVVMVDTGDSYEGICGYYKGTYISYSKEKPISMNPFKVTKEEYDLNFGEKKNFLKSLIFLILRVTTFHQRLRTCSLTRPSWNTTKPTSIPLPSSRRRNVKG